MNTITSTSKTRLIPIAAGVFLLSLCTGIISGNYLKDHTKEADAASANLTIQDNNQQVDTDRSTNTTTITKTSTVTTKDPEATLGYTLLAQLSQSSIPGATVTIYPETPPILPNTSTCTQAAPCSLSTTPTTPTKILETAGTTSNPNPATTTQGDTTIWRVTITLPANTPIGSYILDIAYSEDPILPPPGPPEPNPSTPTTYGAMQKMTNAQCSTIRGTAFDARNGQTYYVQKIGNLCWMETNLRYTGDGNYDSAWNYPDDRYATTTALATSTANPNDNTRPLSTTGSGYLGGTQATQYQQAGYFDPGGSTTLDVTTPTNNTTFYGYLYNWCSAMGGQPNACNNTTGTPQSNFDTTQSICPAGWRLPTGGSGEYQALNIAINSGSTSSDAGLRNNFLAVYSGYYPSLLLNQSRGGYYWSSTVFNATSAYNLDFVVNTVTPGTLMSLKYNGYAVRCVLD